MEKQPTASSQVTREQLLSAQTNEISENHTYRKLAALSKDQHNREVLERIAAEEAGHYKVFRQLTGQDVQPRKFQVFWYAFLARVLGLSFALRLMERGEEVAQVVYARLKEEVPEVADVLLDEQKHEAEILSLLKDERVEYAGSIVLGLSDALVELTGALGGLTFALQNTRFIAMAGFVTGVAASMSMAASEFLSAREQETPSESRHPVKSATYTGISYLVTVLVLVSPYLLLSNVYAALVVMLLLSLGIILAYNFYIATAKGVDLWSRFATMAGISLTVAVISFLVGVVARKLFGVEL